MDTEALRTFLAILDCGSFSSAANRLHRTQPAISRRMALLEDELGVRLFERAAGGLELSDAGRVLLPHARRIMAAMSDGMAAVAELRAGSAGPVSVAAVGTLAGSSLTPVLERFSALHPGADLTLRTATSLEVSELVRSGTATIGLRYHHDRSPELVCTELSAEPLEVICWPSHPLAGARVGSLKRLAGERWLTFPNAARMPETSAHNLAGRFQTLGITDIDWMPVDSLTAQKRLVEARYGLAVLPQSAIDEEVRAGTLAIIRVRGVNLANPVYVVTRKGGYLSKVATTLIDLMISGSAG